MVEKIDGGVLYSQLREHGLNTVQLRNAGNIFNPENPRTLGDMLHESSARAIEILELINEDPEGDGLEELDILTSTWKAIYGAATEAGDVGVAESIATTLDLGLGDWRERD